MVAVDHFIDRLGLQSHLVCFHNDGRQNLLPRFSQKHSGRSLTQEELRTRAQQLKVSSSAQLTDSKLNSAIHREVFPVNKKVKQAELTTGR